MVRATGIPQTGANDDGTAGTLDPRVWNVRDPELPEDAVYCGRPSDFGNPYRQWTIDGTRDEVIAMFEQWVMSKPDFVQKIKHELRGKHLSCWCKPKKVSRRHLFRIANS
jgi:hypothetical protein